MPGIEYDLTYLQAGLVDLEGYLLSKELYWPTAAIPPAGETSYPRLTLGNLLLSRTRLDGRSLNPAQRDELDRLSTRLEATRQHWRTAWETKAARELTARLNMWRDFIEEYREDPESNADRYGFEVNRRVLVELLRPQAGALDPAVLELITALDRLLEAVFVPSGFAWDTALMQSFPQSPYWFLYGKLKSE